MNGPLTALDWLGLLHPVLAILFIYPVAGAAIRLGILAREKRTGYNTALPETVPTEHWQHGRWLVSAMVVASLIAYLESFLRHGADGRSGVLLLAGNHGDEYESQIAVQKLCRSVDPADVCGRLIMIPTISLAAAMECRRTWPPSEYGSENVRLR